MCGICGKTRDPEGTATAAMNVLLEHRGPDDEGRYVDPESGVALGARRLSIIDVEGGHQPLSNEDGDVWAALNGEIYNHPSLQRHLRERGHRLATGTDTEVLVHLYEDYGEALVDALEGMYAFAIWDARRERLLLGRDRFGEKPLFYTERDGVLTFASELTALLAGERLDGELDPQSIDAFFVYGYVPGPGTILRDVRQLPPAHLLTWERRTGASTLRRYWTPPRRGASHPHGWPRVPSRPGAPSPGSAMATGFVSTGELLDEVSGLLDASIRSRMISDVPLGVFLSGGSDSALIAALAARASSEPVKTFTVGYDLGEVSETVPARATARELGADHHELTLTGADVAERAPALLAGLDQPLADQALVALHAVAELARREVTVVIGGEGADELFGGYPRYRWLVRGARIGRVVPAPLAAGASLAVAAAPLPARAKRLTEILRPEPILERHLDWVTFGRRGIRPRLYGPLLRSSAAKERLVEALGDAVGSWDAADAGGGLMRLDQQHWLPDDVRMKADRASMRVSLEVRTPYLQLQLAELAAGVSSETHFGTRGKSLLRGVLDEVLPSAGQRAKRAFRVPAADWLRGPLVPTLLQQLRSGALYSEGWFDRREVTALVSEHVQRGRDWSEVLWPILALGLWLDRFRGANA